MLKEHFLSNQSLNQNMEGMLSQPERPQILQYYNQKLPQNHPLIQILEEMI